MSMHHLQQVAARSCCVLAFALLNAHCQDGGGLLVPDRGVIPRAEARVQDHPGKLVMIPYLGEPVTLTLDASHSSDPDGRIAKFRWLSGTRVESPAAAGAAAPAAGSGAQAHGRVVPKGAEADWPEDVETPSVTLDAGSYAFTLWVIDDRGLVSAPDTLKVVVAEAP
jgi:hypothetical protein